VGFFFLFLFFKFNVLGVSLSNVFSNFCIETYLVFLVREILSFRVLLERRKGRGGGVGDMKSVLVLAMLRFTLFFASVKKKKTLIMRLCSYW